MGKSWDHLFFSSGTVLALLYTPRQRDNGPSTMAASGKDPSCLRTPRVPPKARSRAAPPISPGRGPYSGPGRTPRKASHAAGRIRTEAVATARSAAVTLRKRLRTENVTQTREQAEVRSRRASRQARLPAGIVHLAPAAARPALAHSQGVQQELGGALEGELLPLLERLPALPLVAQVQRRH